MIDTKFSPLMLAGLLPVSQQRSVVDQGPGKTLFIGSIEECREFKSALPVDIRIWCKTV